MELVTLVAVELVSGLLLAGLLTLLNRWAAALQPR